MFAVDVRRGEQSLLVMVELQLTPFLLLLLYGFEVKAKLCGKIKKKMRCLKLKPTDDVALVISRSKSCPAPLSLKLPSSLS